MRSRSAFRRSAARGAPFIQPWPRQERELSRPERLELQQLLAQRGFYKGTPDGQFGGETRQALRNFQASVGAPADGLPPRPCWNSSADAERPFRTKPRRKSHFRISLDGCGPRTVYGGKLPACGPIPLLCEFASRSVEPHDQAAVIPEDFQRDRPWSCLGVTIALLAASFVPALRAVLQFRRSHRSGPRRARADWRRRRLVRRRLLLRRSSSRRRGASTRISPRRRRRRSARARPSGNVMVMGDGMCRLARLGLEDAYTEQPDMGVIRKAKGTSGLIKYPAKAIRRLAAAAKASLATEKPDVIVVMLA